MKYLDSYRTDCHEIWHGHIFVAPKRNLQMHLRASLLEIFKFKEANDLTRLKKNTLLQTARSYDL